MTSVHVLNVAYLLEFVSNFRILFKMYSVVLLLFWKKMFRDLYMAFISVWLS